MRAYAAIPALLSEDAGTSVGYTIEPFEQMDQPSIFFLTRSPPRSPHSGARLTATLALQRLPVCTILSETSGGKVHVTFGSAMGPGPRGHVNFTVARRIQQVYTPDIVIRISTLSIHR